MGIIISSILLISRSAARVHPRNRSPSIDSWIVFALTSGHRAVTIAYRNLRSFPHYVRHYATLTPRPSGREKRARAVTRLTGYTRTRFAGPARVLITAPSHGCMTNTFGNSITPKGHRARDLISASGRGRSLARAARRGAARRSAPFLDAACTDGMQQHDAPRASEIHAGKLRDDNERAVTRR